MSSSKLYEWYALLILNQGWNVKYFHQNHLVGFFVVVAEVNKPGTEPKSNPSQNGNFRKILVKFGGRNFFFDEHNLILLYQ